MNLIETKSAYQNNEMNKVQYIGAMHRLHKRLFDYADFIKNTDISSIEIVEGAVFITFKSNGVKMICDAMDERTAPIEALNFEAYEKEDTNLVMQLIGDDKATILDIGANVGWYSLSVGKMCPKAEIFSFEPIPGTYSYLNKNIEANQLGNIKSHNFGFSNENKSIDFYFYPEGSGNASIEKLADLETVTVIPCQVQKLDDFVELEGISVDFVKCDVEGAELLVFQGGISTIKMHKPIIFTEMLRKWAQKFGYHPNNIIEMLSEVGYRCFSSDNARLVEIFKIDESTIATNFYFLHKDKHIEKIKMLTY